MLHFDSPWAFLLVLLLPYALESETRRKYFTIFRIAGDRREPAVQSAAFSSPVSFSELLSTQGAVRRNSVLNFLRLLTAALLIVALARPQTGTEYTEVETSGRDIMITLDISGSMQALDFMINRQRVSRLAALKSVVKDFVLERKEDRMGLVIFGTDVFTQCPLTSDHKVVADFIDRLDFGMVGDGTALGDAIALSVKRIRDIPGNSKVIVLVTDGVKTAGNIEPKEAAEIAKKENIKIYTVGIGSSGPAPFPVTNAYGQTVYVEENIPLDVETLKLIASTTGGRFFRATRTDSLRDVYQEINHLEERVEKQSQFIDYQEHFWSYLLAALLSFLLHQFLRVTRYLVIP